MKITKTEQNRIDKDGVASTKNRGLKAEKLKTVKAAFFDYLFCDSSVASTLASYSSRTVSSNDLRLTYSEVSYQKESDKVGKRSFGLTVLEL